MQHLHEFLLIFLTGAFILFAPVYIFFRVKMLKNPDHGGFTHKRIMKATFINVVLNIAVYLIFLSMLISVVGKQEVLNTQIWILITFFLIITGLTFYGNGIYITSIVIETFTPKALRRFKLFKTQFIATHLYHGPISHVLIYSGYVLAILLLSIIEISIGEKSLSPNILGICGLVSGIIYFIAHAFNRTILYQLYPSITLLLIFLGIYSNRLNTVLLNYSLSSFFFFFIFDHEFNLFIVSTGKKQKNLEFV